MTTDTPIDELESAPTDKDGNIIDDWEEPMIVFGKRDLSHRMFRRLKGDAYEYSWCQGPWSNSETDAVQATFKDMGQDQNEYLI